MARPPRLNADYFSHDANASIDDRIVFLESRFGLIGYALYFKLLETLTNAEYFEIDWNDTRCAILAKKYGVEATTLQDFVVASTIPEIRAFTTSNGKLYSEDLKSRMSLLVEKREKEARRIAQRRGIDVVGETTHGKDVIVSPTTEQGSTVVSETTPQSKVKHSKVKESKGEERRESEEHTRTPARASPEVQLAELQATAAMSGVPPDFTERLWNHYEATKRMDGSWIDSNGHTISNPAKKIVALWQTERAKPNGNSNAANGIRPQPGKYGDL